MNNENNRFILIGFRPHNKNPIFFTNKTIGKHHLCNAQVRYRQMVKAFTPEAGKIWQSYPEDVKARLLDHIWCGHCQKLSSMDNCSGEIASGLLILKGRCVQCDGGVVRVTGTPKLRSLWYKFFAKRKIEQIIKTSKIYPEP